MCPEVVKYWASALESSNSELSFWDSGRESDGYIGEATWFVAVHVNKMHKLKPSFLCQILTKGRCNKSMCHLLAFISCGCVLIKYAKVTVVIKGGVCVEVFLLWNAWTPCKGKAACNNREYISFVCERRGLALKEVVQDLLMGVCLLLVQLKVFFFLFFIRSQYFACQHRKEKTLLANKSRSHFQTGIS